MTDDVLVDHLAARNIVRIYELADRARIRQRAIEYYEEVGRQARAGRS